MTEQELISKLQELKQIKPKNTWVILSKMSILGNDIPAKKEVLQPAFQWDFSNILGLFYQRKLAYAFAAFLFIFAGGLVFMKYGLPQDVKIAHQSPAALIAENTLKNDVEMFKIKSQNYAQALKSKPQNTALAVREIKEAVKNLTDAIQKNPELAKTVALDVNNNKGYLNVVGSLDDQETADLKETSNVLYATVVDPLIKSFEDLKEKGNLIKDQEIVLNSAKEKRAQGNNIGALQDILLMNASMKGAK